MNNKLGLMVFYIHVGTLPMHRSMSYIESIKKQIMDGKKETQLTRNYDTMFIPSSDPDNRDTVIEMFPYENV